MKVSKYWKSCLTYKGTCSGIEIAKKKQEITLDEHL